MNITSKFKEIVSTYGETGSPNFYFVNGFLCASEEVKQILRNRAEQIELNQEFTGQYIIELLEAIEKEVVEE